MKKQIIRNRKVRFGTVSVVLTVLVIAVTVLFNTVFDKLAERYLWYTPMTEEGSYDVTEDCFALLDGIFSQSPSGQVEIIFCDLPEKLEVSATSSYVYKTATSIAERFTDRVKITCYDIWTNPVSVKKYSSTFNPLTGDPIETKLKSTSVIITSGEYYRVYDITEFFVFENGDTSKVWAYNGEKKLTAGILRATDPVTHTVCLTNNHGETFYDYELLYLLDNAGYTILYMDLLSDAIPADCNLIISYNPNSDLIKDSVSSTSETDILDEFLSKDGNTFLVLTEDGTPSLPNYEEYLAQWGVSFGYYKEVNTGLSFRYMVQDTAHSLTSDGYTIYGEAVRTGRSGEILDGVGNNVVFKNATALSPAQGFVNNGDGSYTSGSRTLYSLFEGSDSAVSWANGKAVSGDGAMLMTLTEEKHASGSSYVGVLASVDFSAETFLQSAVYGNGDTMNRLFRSVGKEFVPEGLTIKPFASTDISTVTTAEMLRWTICLSVIPVAVVALLGVVILVRRRRA